MPSITVAGRSNGLGPVLLSCWDCVFEPRRLHGCLYLALCLVLLGRDFCVRQITGLYESHRLCCV